MSDKYSTEIDFSDQIRDNDALAKKFTTKYRNDLPDSDFAYIAPGGKKVDGKTEPRSLRHFPIPDAAHVRNALARLSQSKLSPDVKAKILKKLKSKAKEFGIEVSEEAKAYYDDSIEEHFKNMREGLRQKMQNQDSYDVKHETLKELRKHHEDALKNIDQEMKSLERDKTEDQGDIGQE
jgi:hypothetical protein